MSLCRCGAALPYPSMRHCSRQCLDAAIDSSMIEALKEPKKRPVFKKKNIRWCGWCGDTLPKGRNSFCSEQCRSSYRIDIGLST